MGCTYSAPRFVDSSNNKPRLVYIDPSSEDSDKTNKESTTHIKVQNKSKNAFKKAYAF